MTVRTKSASSEIQRLPPPFGERKSWQLRFLEWRSRDPKDPNVELLNTTMTIFRGTRVHEKLHAAYWEARNNSAKAIEMYRKAGVPPPYSYLLFNKIEEMAGYSAFDAQDDADDMAWISCLFLEMGLKIAFPMPPDVTDNEVGAPICPGAERANAER
jgi:hypothetical protein